MARVSPSWALILGLLAGIGPMCTDLYLPALPEMSEQLAATTTITQLTLTASLIGLGVGQLLFGPLSDKIGRKRPLILSLLLFIVSSILLNACIYLSFQLKALLPVKPITKSENPSLVNKYPLYHCLFCSF